MGKGSTQRPRQVEQPVYEENWNNTFGEGVFHRYQLTKHAVEHKGELCQMVLDRDTMQLHPWHDEPRRGDSHPKGCGCKDTVEKE